MPDFFDRLVARGTPSPSAGPLGISQDGQDRASHSGPGAQITLARPRLPGPFEWPGAELREEAAEAPAARPAPAPAWPARGGPARGPGQGPASAHPGGPPAGYPHQPAAPAPPGDQGPRRNWREPLAAPPSAIPAGAVAPALPPRPAIPAGQAVPEDPAHKAQAGDRAGRRDEAVPGARQPAGPRPLAIPASAVRPVPPADMADDAPARPETPAVVQLRIGRIEVRAARPQQPGRQGKPSAGRAGPALTLAQYLEAAGGTGGQR